VDVGSHGHQCGRVGLVVLPWGVPSCRRALRRTYRHIWAPILPDMGGWVRLLGGLGWGRRVGACAERVVPRPRQGLGQVRGRVARELVGTIQPRWRLRRPLSGTQRLVGIRRRASRSLEGCA
jgi:hypothetical protein